MHVPGFLAAGLAVVLMTQGVAGAAPATPVTEYVIRSWSADEGLPHPVVSRIEQDSAGFLWLATMAGLARFDGREFKVFGAPQPMAGSGRNIRGLALTADGSVLFLPAGGGIFQLKDKVITRHALSGQFAHEDLRELYVEPRSGVIWVGLAEGIARCENGRVERFGAADGIARRALRFSWATDAMNRTWIGGPDFAGYYQGGKLVRVPAETGVIYCTAASRSGGVWVFGNGLFKSDNGALNRVATDPLPIGRSSVRCLYEDRKGILWLGTSREGVLYFDGGVFRQVPHIEPAVEWVSEDSEGDLWLATSGGGIRRLRTKFFTWIDGPVTSVCEDRSGALWFAAGADGIVQRVGNSQKSFPLPGTRGPLNVSAIAADLEGHLWLGSRTGVYQTSANEPGNPRRIDPALVNTRILFCSRAGDVWAAGLGLLGYFRGEKFTSLADRLPPQTDITSMAESPAGHLWFGTSRGLVYEFAGGSLSPSSILPEMGGGIVHAVLPESPDTLWLATSEGLVFADHGKVRRFTQADGLPDDIILQLLPDDQAHLWITTPHGLFRLDRDNLLRNASATGVPLTVVRYGPEQGMAGVSPITNYQPAALKDQRGNLWFCTYKGALGIDPSRIESNASPPRLLIDEVLLNGQHAGVRGGLRVPPGEQQLEFRFAALSFPAPEQVRLRHQLEGFDSGWVETPPDRRVRYAKLPPGNYLLRVMACSSEGIWNQDEVQLGIRVMPVWWQTAWFRAGLLLGFAGLIGGSVRFWSQRKLRARIEGLERDHALEKERTRIARDMHDDLGSSLTAINLTVQRLRESRTPEMAGVVDLLHRRVRQLTLELDRVVWTVSSKNSSLDRLAGFIERFAQSLFVDTPILCCVSGAAGIPSIALTPEAQHHVLAVTKETLSNGLKHSQATEVTVTMGFQDDEFTLVIRDNGRGFETGSNEHSRRNGLRNIRARASEMGATVEIRSTPGTGTEVELRLSVKPPKKK